MVLHACQMFSTIGPWGSPENAEMLPSRGTAQAQGLRKKAYKGLTI